MLGTGQLQSVGLVGSLSLAQPLSYHTITITLPSHTSVPQYLSTSHLTPYCTSHLTKYYSLFYIKKFISVC